jgi:hypothetical protein
MNTDTTTTTTTTTTPADTVTPNCPYQEWTGKPIPTSREELWEEYERLSSPTFAEFSADRAAAAAVCHAAALIAV